MDNLKKELDELKKRVEELERRLYPTPPPQSQFIPYQSSSLVNKIEELN